MRIPLPDGTFGYGRVLEEPFDAFYAYRTMNPEADLDKIASSPILFKLAVRYPAPSPWKIIGWRALEERLTQPVVQFRQDIADFRRCTIFDTTGNARAVEPHECVGLERLAVWEQRHIEERLMDAFMGRPNATVERLRVRLG